MMELELIVSGESLDLAPGTSISMVFNNSLLDSDVLQGSYSLPFNLPDTPKNRRILNFPAVIESLSDLETKYDCQLRYEVISINAEMRIREVKDTGGFSVNLLTDIGSVAEKLKSTKLNQLDLESIPLPFEERPTISIPFILGGSISIGTLILFRIYRQDFSDYIFPVTWAGSLAQFLQDLVFRITTPSPGVPAWSGIVNYNSQAVVQDGSGDYWECQYDGVIGKVPKESTAYSGVTPYIADDLVYDGGQVYEAILPSTGVATSNVTYWRLVGDDDYWIFLSNSAGWPAAWRSGVTPNYYLYDDPLYNWSLGAEYFENTLYVYDQATGGEAPMDYLLIWGQTFGDLTIEVGLQNVDGGDFETNFRLPINRMLQKQLGKQWPETNYAFLPYRNTGSFDDASLAPDVPTRPYINYFIDGHYKYGNVNLISASKQFFVPQVALLHILEELFAYLGTSYDLATMVGSPEAFDRLHLYNTRAAVKYVREVGGSGYFTFPFAIDLADHVPAITLGDFLNSIRQFLFLGFVFDSTIKRFKVVRLKDVVLNSISKDWTHKADYGYSVFRDNPEGFTLSYTIDSNDELAKQYLPDISNYIINDSVPDEASLPLDVSEIGKLRIVRDKESYYLASWSVANTVSWSFFSKYLQPMKIGGGKTIRKPSISSVLDTRIGDEVGLAEFGLERNWQLPEVKQKLAIPDLNIDSQAALRLMFNWGLQMDTSGNKYPFGSGQNLDYAGTELGSLALRYDSSRGIYEKLGKEWLAFLQNTKRIQRSIRMNSMDVATLAQDDTIRVDRVDYLWKSFRITFPIKPTSKAEFELWKK